MTDQKPNIYQRLNAVQKDVRGVGKHRTNQHQRYNYAGHEDVTEALRDSYVKHGIIRSAEIVDAHLDASACFIAKCRIEWVNIDDPQDRHVVHITSLAPSTSGASKGQLPAATHSGVALSYAVKTAEFKVLALTGDDTPDASGEEQTRGAEKAAEAARFSVDELVAAFDNARTERDLQNARASVNTHLRHINAADRDRLQHAKNACVERNGWTPR
jgi:hypothetical protein